MELMEYRKKIAEGDVNIYSCKVVKLDMLA